MTNRRRLGIWTVMVAAVAAAGLGLWYSSGSHERHVTGLLDQAFFDLRSAHFGVDSGPCIDGIAPETQIGNFEPVASFAP